MVQVVNVLKQDSNQTGLRYSVEVSPGVVDANAVWLLLEPNSYKEFGGKVKTKARMPIAADRNLRKAVVVDLDAMTGFQQDLTASNFQDLAQCFFYALLRTKSEFTIPSVGGSHNYLPTIGADQYTIGDLIFAKNFNNTLNNGLQSVTTPFPTTTAGVTVTNTNVTTETDTAAPVGVLSRVGFQFNSGDCSINVSGALPALTVTSVAATDTITASLAPANNDTVTIGDYIYTFQTALTAGKGHVLINGQDGSLTNLANAINFTGGGVPGTDYDNTKNAFVVFTETGSNNFVNGDTIQIGNRIYTFQTTLTNVDGNVLIGANFAASATNLVNIINGNTAFNGINYFFGGGYGAGTSDPNVTASTVTTTITLTARALGEAGAAVPVTYTAAGTSAGSFGSSFLAGASYANPWVTSSAVVAHVITLTAAIGGTVGNNIPVAKSSANLTLGAATLTGGTGGRALNSFGLIQGEFIFIGSDETNTSFATVGDNGFCRIRSISANSITFDKTQFTMSADSGTGKTIRIYFGRVVRNENTTALQVKRSLQFERTLGAADFTQPSQIQAEYLVRVLANDVIIDMKTADIIRCELDFMANKNTVNTSQVGVKAGTRPSLTTTDAFNATSDVAFSKMAIVTTGNASPNPLFAFLTDIKYTIKNNLKQNKAVSVLGAFDSTPGFFQVLVDLSAYFTDVGEIQAVINNSSITLETHLVKQLIQQGITIDIPLLVLSEALANVKLNEPIMMPLKSDASIATTIDPGLVYTALMIFWDYLPLAAG